MAQPKVSNDIITEANFLIDRLYDLEIPESLAKDWYGHVSPAMARLRSLLLSHEAA